MNFNKMDRSVTSITWNEQDPIPHSPKQSPDIYTELKKLGSVTANHTTKVEQF